MHGAIVADALRVPWLPVCCNDDILAFKWQDWLSTLKLPYEPSRITSLSDLNSRVGNGGRLKAKLKRGLQRSGLWSRQWTVPPPADTGPAKRDRALADLRAICAKSPYLSDEGLLLRHTEHLLQLLKQVRPK